MKTFSDRLRWLINKFAGGVQSDFSKMTGILPGPLNNYLGGRLPKADQLIRIRESVGVDLNWLLTGAGDPFTSQHDQVKDSQDIHGGHEGHELVGLLEMTGDILRSGTEYQASLAANIRSFHHAMIAEQRMAKAESRIDKLERMLVEATASRIREHDDPDKKDELLKLRVISAIVKSNNVHDSQIT